MSENSVSRTQGFGLKAVRSAVLRRPWVVVGATVVGFLLGVVGGIGTVPEYTATATMLVESQAQEVMSLEDLFGQNKTAAITETQVAMLRGRAMALRVVESEDLTEAPELRIAQNTAPWAAAGRWAVAVQKSINDSVRSALGREVPAATTPRNGQRTPTDAAVLAFQRRLSIVPVRDTNLVGISFTHPDPAFAARVAGATAQGFIDFNLQTRRERATELSGYLEAQIQSLREDIAEAEGLQNGLVEGGSEPGDLVSLISGLRTRHEEARNERVQADIKYQQLLLADPADVAEVREHADVASLRGEVDEKEVEYAELTRVFSDSYPRVGEVERELQRLRDRLANEQRSVLQTLITAAKAEHELAMDREERLLDMIEQQRSELVLREESLQEWDHLQMRIDNSKELIGVLLERLADTDMTGNMQGVDSLYLRVVEPARVPARPDNPARALVVFGLLGGFVLGVLGAFGLEMIDNTLKTTHAAESGLGLPGLVVVPNAAGGGGLLGRVRGYNSAYDYTDPQLTGYGYGDEAKTGDLRRLPNGAEPALATITHPHSMMAESFRALRTRLLFAGEEGLPKTIAVTSSSPGEGKTTTSVNLACALAMVGKKTLLVDADLRKPSLHKFLPTRPSPGLAALLENGADLKRMVQRTGTENLWVLPAGERTEMPLELLSTPRCAEVLQQAGRLFDVVIVDTPPLLRAVDALALVGRMDATMMVVQRGITPLPVVDQVCQMVEEAQGQVLGVLLNDSGKKQWRPVIRKRVTESPKL